MQTKIVVESLLDKFSTTPSSHMSKVLRVCRVINGSEGRDWQAKKHPEMRGLLSNFEKPVCICTVSTIITCLIIEPKPRKRLYQTIKIIGNTTEFLNISKSQISKIIYDSLNIKDFLPPVYANQIYYIPWKDDFIDDRTPQERDLQLLSNINDSEQQKETIEAFVFSEYNNGQWTVDDDITAPVQKTSMTVTPSTIIKNILKEF